AGAAAVGRGGTLVRRGALVGGGILLDGHWQRALDRVPVAGDDPPLDVVGAGRERLLHSGGGGGAVDGRDDLGDLLPVVVTDPHQRADVEDVGGEGEGDLLGGGLEGRAVLGIGAEQRAVRLRGGGQGDQRGEEKGAGEREQTDRMGGERAAELGHHLRRLRQPLRGGPWGRSHRRQRHVVVEHRQRGACGLDL